MKRIFYMLLLVFTFFIAAVLALAQEEKVITKTFNIYSDKNASDNNYVPSGRMGDYGDLMLNDQSTDNPHSGTTCLQFVYNAKRSQRQNWAGIYWQNPPNNWGSKKGGFDLTGMTKIIFWARGAKGGEVVQKFMVGGIKGTYPDSTKVEIGPIKLTDTWQEYTIDLTGKSLSYISGGFSFTFTASSNPKGATFYLDDIKFIAETAAKPKAKKKKK